MGVTIIVRGIYGRVTIIVGGIYGHDYYSGWNLWA